MSNNRKAPHERRYELAKRTGITAQQLANYERGRSKATVDKAAAICRALNVTFTIGT